MNSGVSFIHGVGGRTGNLFHKVSPAGIAENVQPSLRDFLMSHPCVPSLPSHAFCPDACVLVRVNSTRELVV